MKSSRDRINEIVETARKNKSRWSLDKRQFKTLMDNYAALLQRHPDSELFQRKYQEYKQKFEDAE